MTGILVVVVVLLVVVVILLVVVTDILIIVALLVKLQFLLSLMHQVYRISTTTLNQGQGQCVDRKLGFLCKCKLQKLPHTMQRKHKLGASTLCCEQNKGLELSTPTRADYFIPAVNNGGD